MHIRESGARTQSQPDHREQGKQGAWSQNPPMRKLPRAHLEGGNVGDQRTQYSWFAACAADATKKSCPSTARARAGI